MNWRTVILLMMIFPFIATLSNSQDKIFNLPKPNERCCEKEVLILKRVINTPEIWRSDIFASVDASREGKNTLGAGTYGCIWLTNESVSNCEISVTEKLLYSFSREELIAVLAHEFGHIINPKQGHSIQDEFYADEFSFKMLGELDINQRAALSALQKILKDLQPITEKQKLSELLSRIAHTKRLLETENTNRP